MSRRLPPPRFRRLRVTQVLLCIAGAALVVLSFAADVLASGAAGFGTTQWTMLLVGIALCFAAVRLQALLPLLVRAGESARQALRADDRDVLLPPAAIAIVALTVACTGALLEGVVLGVSAAMGEMLRLGVHTVWMAAATNAIVLLAAGALLAALGIVWRKARAPAVVMFVFGLLAIDAILHRSTLADRADDWSKWLLSAGVAAFAARTIAPRLRPGGRGLARTAATSLGGVLVVAAIAFARVPLGERIARRALPVADEGPNILLIILDTVRAASLGLHGYERPTTPNLERFARSGIVFERAIAPSSWTLPSHASMFTGRYPSELSADWRERLDDTHPTFAEVLASRGYATAAFSANGAYANANTGLERGFARFEDFPVTAGEALRTSSMLRQLLRRTGAEALLREGYAGRKPARDIANRFLEWQAALPDDRPFFAFLNVFDAHDPFMAAPPFDTLFGPVAPFEQLRWGREPTASLMRSWTDHYDRAIAYVDHELHLLFEELARRGVLDRTIVVVTADHGEHLGEHGFMRHGTTLYLQELHVPLVVRYPASVPAGMRVQRPVTLRDLPATLLDLASVPGAPLPGASLAAVWRESEPTLSVPYSRVSEGVRAPARYPTSNSDLHSLVARGFHFIRDEHGTEWLYRYEEDPGELRNLAEATGTAGELAWLRETLARYAAGDSLARAAMRARE